jgi:hypothetical protein
MARKTPIGDKNRICVYAKDGDDVGALLFTFDKTTGASIEGDVASNNAVISFTSEIDNEEFKTFKASYLSTTVPEEVVSKYTDGSEDKSYTSGGGTQVYVVHVGGQENNGKCAVTLLNSVFSIDGAKEISPDTPVAIPCKFTGVPNATQFDVAFATLAADYSDVVTIGTNLTNITNTVGVEKYYTAV